jgi:hypothetical protein
MTMDRRALLGLALAAPFGLAAAPARGIREAEARAEFLKILAMFNKGDVAGFLAYGPPKLVVDRRVIEHDALPAFFESCSHLNGKPDEKPAWIEGKLLRRKKPSLPVIYGAMTKRSVWLEAYCEEHDTNGYQFCREAGYGLRYEHWQIAFDGPRIVEINQWLAMQ